MPTTYVAPSAVGNGSGADPANALSLSSLNQAIQLAGAGGTVVLLADRGAYNVSTAVSLSSGGTAAAPITIIGADSLGNPADITINGTRGPIYQPGMPPGNQVFRLLAGADNLVFENMSFNNVGTAFRVGANVSNLTITNMHADNVQRFFENYVSGTNTSATISGLHISNVEVHGFSKGVIRLQYDTHDAVIEDVYGDSEYQDGDPIAMGIHLEGTVHDVTIANSTMENAISSSTAYWNGDGFATERGVYNVTFQDCVARGSADGGFDLKSTATTLINPVAEGNAHNYRFWGQIDVVNPTGVDPHYFGGVGRQFQVQILNGAVVQVTGGWFSDSGSSTEVVVNDGGTSINFQGTQFIYASGAKLSVGSSIYGIDPTLTHIVSPTGPSSVNGEELIGQFDGGSEPTPGENHAPSAPTNSGRSDLSGSIAEDATVGASVGITASSTDVDPGDGITYSFGTDASGNPLLTTEVFSINPLTGIVSLSGAIDYETKSSYAFSIFATDKANASSSSAFMVKVTNVAPAAPADIDSSTQDSLSEGSGSDAYSGVTLFSQDPQGGAVTYTLLDGAGGRFAMESSGRIITTGAVALDYETAKVDAHGNRYYDVRVSASDGTASSTSTLKIYVTNLVEHIFTDGNDGSTAAPINFNLLVDGTYDLNDMRYFSGAGDDFVVLPNISVIDSGNPWDFAKTFDAGVGDDLVQGGTGGDIISGNDGNDRLFGAGGNDKLSGGLGNDVLIAGAGSDTLTGSAGLDVFVLTRSELGSTKSGPHDVITDFQQGSDKIDISALYSAHSIGSMKAGKASAVSALNNYDVIYFSSGGKTYVAGDTNGARGADFTIELTGTLKLSPSDFIAGATQWPVAYGTYAELHQDFFFV